MAALIFRSGHAGDAGAIGDLWFDSWMSSKPAHRNVTRADLIERAAAEMAGRWEVTLAEADGKLLGFMAIAPAERRLDQIFVSPSAQGQSIGAELMSIAKRRLPDGFWLKVDGANARARKFYEREGLTLTRTEGESGRERMIYSFAP